MCVIIYKHSKAKLPTSDILTEASKRNPDGIGIAYTTNGKKKVMIEKGISLDYLLSINKEGEYLSNQSVIYHFRIATSGGKEKSHCHPFPLSEKLDDLSSTEGLFNTVLAHNGRMSSFENNKEYSDSQMFIHKIVSKLSFNDLSSIKIRRLFKAATQGSRFIFLNKNGNICKFGQWIKEGGLWYSNDTLTKKKTTKLVTAYQYDYLDYGCYNDYGCSYNYKISKNHDNKSIDTSCPDNEGIPKCHSYLNSGGISCKYCMSVPATIYCDDFFNVSLCYKCYQEFKLNQGNKATDHCSMCNKSEIDNGGKLWNYVSGFEDCSLCDSCKEEVLKTSNSKGENHAK
ncbi:class II glutamine amidotransferase [bacterium]|nr:class II glutamine amidotransferase [bacterium]